MHNCITMVFYTRTLHVLKHILPKATISSVLSFADNRFGVGGLINVTLIDTQQVFSCTTFLNDNLILGTFLSKYAWFSFSVSCLSIGQKYIEY